MDRLLVASSPVEIEAKAGEAGLPPEVHDVALALFHELTDRLGQAARLMPGHEAGFPASRFYLAAGTGSQMAALLEELRRRPDLIEMDGASPAPTEQTRGLFSSRSHDGVTGLLVKHQARDGLPMPADD